MYITIPFSSVDLLLYGNRFLYRNNHVIFEDYLDGVVYWNQIKLLLLFGVFWEFLLCG